MQQYVHMGSSVRYSQRKSEKLNNNECHYIMFSTKYNSYRRIHTFYSFFLSTYWFLPHHPYLIFSQFYVIGFDCMIYIYMFFIFTCLLRYSRLRDLILREEISFSLEGLSLFCPLQSMIKFYLVLSVIILMNIMTVMQQISLLKTDYSAKCSF